MSFDTSATRLFSFARSFLFRAAFFLHLKCKSKHLYARIQFQFAANEFQLIQKSNCKNNMLVFIQMSSYILHATVCMISRWALFSRFWCFIYCVRLARAFGSLCHDLEKWLELLSKIVSWYWTHSFVMKTLIHISSRISKDIKVVRVALHIPSHTWAFQMMLVCSATVVWIDASPFKGNAWNGCSAIFIFSRRNLCMRYPYSNFEERSMKIAKQKLCIYTVLCHNSSVSCHFVSALRHSSERFTFMCGSNTPFTQPFGGMHSPRLKHLSTSHHITAEIQLNIQYHLSAVGRSAKFSRIQSCARNTSGCAGCA